MGIQDQIDARIAGLEVALSIKLRTATRVRYRFERHSEETGAFIFYFDAATQCHSLAHAPTIDGALDAAMHTILAMRSIEDENADLGLPAPARETEAVA